MSNEKEFEAMFGDSDQILKETDTGLFVRLKDGEEVDLYFEPIPVFSYKIVWIGGTNGNSEIYDESKHSGERPSGKHRFVVARLTENGPEPAILEVSNQVYEMIKDLLKRKGFGRSYTYTRKGTGTDTKYFLVNNDPLSDEQLEVLKSLKWPDHTKLGGDDEEPSNEKSDAPKKKSPWGK